MYAAAKRLLDIAVSLLAILVLALPMALIWASIRITMGKPALFKMERPGRNGQPFVMYKFRTMSNTTHDESGQALGDAERLTRLGRWLRRSSLDELPELVNVLRGEMSLVGPRPLLTRYLPRYSPTQARRHEVRPGLTGWAQVNGRNAITWPEKFDLDVWYVDNRGFWLDLKILGLTAAQVVRGRGVSATGFATMPEFFGTDHEGNPE